MNTAPQPSPGVVQVWIASYNACSYCQKTAWASREKARAWCEAELNQLIDPPLSGEWQVNDSLWELEADHDGLYGRLESLAIMDAIGLAVQPADEPPTFGGIGK